MIYSFLLISENFPEEEIINASASLSQYEKQSFTFYWAPFQLIISGDTLNNVYFQENGNHLIFLDSPFLFRHYQEEIDFYLSGNWDFKQPFSMDSMFIFYNEQKQKIIIYNPLPGIIPVYFSQNSTHFWACSEIKVWKKSKFVSLKLIDYSVFRTLGYRSPVTYNSVWEAIGMLCPQTILSIQSGKIEISPLSMPLEIISDREEDFWTEQIYTTLHETTAALRLNTEDFSGIGLSGGYDSGSIAAILTHQKQKIIACTIGTNEKNEWNDATLSSKKFQIPHFYQNINEDEYWQMYLKAIWFNEISRTEIAVGYPGLYQTYSFFEGKCSNVITGYGADILLGNITHEKDENLQSALLPILYQTAVSGELSPFLGFHHSVKAIPLYMHPSMIALCLKMPGLFKTKNKTQKYIQKEMLKRYDMLPEELLSRQKSGLHTGAGLPEMFDKITGNTDKDPEFRTKFLYKTLQLLFEQAIEIENISIEQIFKTLNYAKQ